MKKVLQNGVFIFLFLMGIQSFFIKGPYMVVLGSMLILTSILFFPYIDKVMNLIKVVLTKMQKTFIGLINFIIVTYSMAVDETKYVKYILQIVVMMIVWIGTIVYSKLKSKRS